MKQLYKIVFLYSIAFSGAVSGAGTVADAINDGKSYGAEVNATTPDPATIQPADTVPGYQTATPPETDYYGNSAALGDAAAQAAAQNEAANMVTDGFSSRPVFNIDPVNDPIFVNKEQIEANAGQITGGMGGTSTDCVPTVIETPYPPTTETCYEYRVPQRVTCSNVLNIQVDMPTNTTIATGAWTGSSGDCGPDTWSNAVSVACPAGFYGPLPKAIQRQAKWKSRNPWGEDTGWQVPTSVWTARTEITCSSTECTYRTKGIDQYFTPQWGKSTCGGDKWYTRMRLQVECRAEPVVTDVWDNGCTALEARTQ